jgi:hypothetical protein
MPSASSTSSRSLVTTVTPLSPMRVRKASHTAWSGCVESRASTTKLVSKNDWVGEEELLILDCEHAAGGRPAPACRTRRGLPRRFT